MCVHCNLIHTLHLSSPYYNNLIKMLIEMDAQLQKNKSELDITEISLSKLNQNNKIIELSKDEIKNSNVENVWKGIGKIFIKENTNDYINELNNDKKEYDEQINSLNKKKHYLETSIEKTFDSMNQIIKKNTSSSSSS